MARTIEDLEQDAVNGITACGDNRLSKQELIDLAKRLLREALMLGDKCEECYRQGYEDATTLAWTQPSEDDGSDVPYEDLP